MKVPNFIKHCCTYTRNKSNDFVSEYAEVEFYQPRYSYPNDHKLASFVTVTLSILLTIMFYEIANGSLYVHY